METFTTATSIDTLKEGDSITFLNSVVFGDRPFGYTIQRVTEKALQIDGHWLPKSQIHAEGLAKVFSHDEQYNRVSYECLAIRINEWFDKKMYRSLPKGYAF
jgi:hypothetical protein